jgi:excisionase family DNA binding protein
MHLSDYLTVTQYADKYGLSKYTLYKHIQNGLLEVERKGSVYLIKDQKPAYKQTGRRGKLQDGQ